jgi:hypothetical protein
MNLMPSTPRERGYYAAATKSSETTPPADLTDPKEQDLWKKGYEEAKRDAPVVQHQKLESFG